MCSANVHEFYLQGKFLSSSEIKRAMRQAAEVHDESAMYCAAHVSQTSLAI